MGEKVPHSPGEQEKPSEDANQRLVREMLFQSPLQRSETSKSPQFQFSQEQFANNTKEVQELFKKFTSAPGFQEHVAKLLIFLPQIHFPISKEKAIHELTSIYDYEPTELNIIHERLYNNHIIPTVPIKNQTGVTVRGVNEIGFVALEVATKEYKKLLGKNNNISSYKKLRQTLRRTAGNDAYEILYPDFSPEFPEHTVYKWPKKSPTAIAKEKSFDAQLKDFTKDDLIKKMTVMIEGSSRESDVSELPPAVKELFRRLTGNARFPSERDRVIAGAEVCLAVLNTDEFKQINNLREFVDSLFERMNKKR